MPRPVHFEIHADDPERAIEFYSNAFGWKFARWGGEGPAYWLITTGDEEARGINGGLMKRKGLPPSETQPVSSYVITVDVEDLDATTKSVCAAGGRQVVDKSAVPGVGWLGYFKDTEGNIFGMMQPDAAAK